MSIIRSAESQMPEALLYIVALQKRYSNRIR